MPRFSSSFRFLGQGNQLGVEGVHVLCPAIVFIDELLELLVVIHAALIEAHHSQQLGVDAAAQLLGFDVLAAFLELLLEGFKVDLCSSPRYGARSVSRTGSSIG